MHYQGIRMENLFMPLQPDQVIKLSVLKIYWLTCFCGMSEQRTKG